jgi:hypothetical protein
MRNMPHLHRGEEVKLSAGVKLLVDGVIWMSDELMTKTKLV